MDVVSLERIKLMHPKVRKELLDAYTHINNNILGKGSRLRLAYTLRTNAEQDALFAQGRTVLFDKSGKRLGKVTNAKGGQSIHNYALAFDIVLLSDKNNDGVFETALWDTKVDLDKDGASDWMEVTKYFQSLGWEWGGSWKFVDPPHFQKAFGHTWRTLKAKIDSGAFTTEVINGKTYRFANL